MEVIHYQLSVATSSSHIAVTAKGKTIPLSAAYIRGNNINGRFLILFLQQLDIILTASSSSGN